MNRVSKRIVDTMIKHLFKDVKFRIVNELRAAGLTANPYAHEVIVQMNAPRELAPYASAYY